VFLGGVRPWKKAAFPLALLLFVNPVPTGFNLLVDLPLQYLAAAATRSFAHLIGVPFEGDALQLMFAPDLGILIAPGCNGIRGSVTMGYIALVTGWLYRLNGRRHMLFVATAVLLGYVFNLLRLCFVILYYWFAIRFPTLGWYGEEADYVIGGCLFFMGALFVFALPRRLAAAAPA
jgi:exosortase J